MDNKPPNTMKAIASTSGKMQNTSAIDLEMLTALKHTIGEVFNEIIPAYIEQSDEMLNDIENLLAKGDNQSVERYAHSMKSSSHSVGALHLSEIARVLEQKTNEGSESDILMKYIVSLKHEYEQVKTALIAYK